MKQFFLSLFVFSIFCSSGVYADHVIWSEEVKSDGTPSAAVSLNLGKKYRIRVSGEINLDKWWQAGKPLGEDAYYEYNEEVVPIKLDTLKNSSNLLEALQEIEHSFTSKDEMQADYDAIKRALSNTSNQISAESFLNYLKEHPAIREVYGYRGEGFV